MGKARVQRHKRNAYGYKVKKHKRGTPEFATIVQWEEHTKAKRKATIDARPWVPIRGRLPIDRSENAPLLALIAKMERFLEEQESKRKTNN
jgi:hypothetical protein